MKGTIKWYNAKKGFGFIKTDDENDVFVHKSEVPNGTFLNEGDKVEYEVKDAEKGKVAINIKKIEE